MHCGINLSRHPHAQQRQQLVTNALVEVDKGPTRPNDGWGPEGVALRPNAWLLAK